MKLYQGKQKVVSLINYNYLRKCYRHISQRNGNEKQAWYETSFLHLLIKTRKRTIWFLVTAAVTVDKSSCKYRARALESSLSKQLSFFPSTTLLDLPIMGKIGIATNFSRKRRRLWFCEKICSKKSQPTT